jgi:hypothetical protein
VTFAPRPIDDVLAQLLEEDDDQFVYRGQSRDYGIVLPSGMRGAVRSVTGAACQLDRRVLVAQCTVRAQQQILFRQGLISTLGAGIGHVFAQQYGFGSDVIDVSSSPRIAAFFATRLWPTCSHIADAPGPGVIYRWRKPEEERTLTELRADTLLGSVNPIDKEDVTPVRAIVRFPERGTPDYTLVRDMQDAWIVFPTMIFTVTEIAAAFSDLLENASADHIPGWQFEHFPSSRWAAQGGGFLRPETLYRGYLGLPPVDGFKITKDDELDELRLDRHVLGGSPAEVTDAAQIGPPDCFHFQHGGSSVDIEPEQLWPSALKDQLFRYVSVMTWVRQGHYFNETRVNFPWDRVAGLVDRGFYPEVEDETYNRTELELFSRLLGRIGSEWGHPG